MRVCFFGDSFTNGTGDDACLGWVGRVCASHRKSGLDLTHYNLGVRGDTSADIAMRWYNEASARLPEDAVWRLVFSFGNNDTALADDGGKPRLSLEQSLRNAQAILIAAREMAPTLMIGPVPAFGDHEHKDRLVEMSEALGNLCDELKVPFLSLTGLPDPFWAVWRREAQKGDGVHPNSGGYESLAGAIGNWPPLASWRSDTA